MVVIIIIIIIIEGHNYLYNSSNIVRVIKIEKNEMGWACSAYGGEESCTQGFGGKSEGKRQLGRSRLKWENHIKMDLQEMGCGGVDWIDLAQDRDRWWALVNAAVNIRVP